MNAGLRESLQAVLEQPILNWLPVSGGCIRACHQFSQMTAATQWIAPRKAQARLS